MLQKMTVVLKAYLLGLTVLLCLGTPVTAQHFLTVGTGAGLRIFASDEVDRFADTYNRVNRDNLASLLGGFNGAEGLRFEVGYRYWKKNTAATIIGWTTSVRNDNATFNNDEVRSLELKSNRFYLEGEFGRPFGDVFVNGVLALFFNREQEIEAEYFDQRRAPVDKRLNGIYRARTDFSTDIGIAAGFYRKPIFLVLKITQPILATNESDLLSDNRTEKVVDNSNIFPDDFFSFTDREDYAGVPNKMDGLKISLVVSFAMEL